MKKMIRAASIFDLDYNKQVELYDDKDEWIPPLFTEALVDDIINRIRVKCIELYSRRFPNLFVEFDDEYWGSSGESGGKMHV